METINGSSEKRKEKVKNEEMQRKNIIYFNLGMLYLCDTAALKD